MGVQTIDSSSDLGAAVFEATGCRDRSKVAMSSNSWLQGIHNLSSCRLTVARVAEQVADDVAWFRFETLCQGARSTAEYI